MTATRFSHALALVVLMLFGCDYRPVYGNVADFKREIESWAIDGKPAAQALATVEAKGFACERKSDSAEALVCKRRASNYVCAQDQTVLLLQTAERLIASAEPYDWPKAARPYTCL